MEKVAPNSKFVGHSTEIIWQSKIKVPLQLFLKPLLYLCINSCVHQGSTPEVGTFDMKKINLPVGH